jgi:hypothetical protein
MAITAKSEEVVIEVARAIGDIYEAIHDGVGSEALPGTALFEVRNLERLASNSLPYFGVLETDPAGFEISYDETNDPYFVTVGPGEIGFNGSRLSILAQRIPIRRDFAQSYNNTDQYGIRLGFPIEEARRSTRSYSTTVSANAFAGATELPVADTATVEALGFPIQAHVGTTFIVFSGLNASKTALVIDPGFNNGTGYGTLAATVYAGTAVRFIYEPRIRAVCGLPQAGVGSDPDDFTYYPPLPKSWLPIADLLIINPADPRLAGSDPNWAVRSTLVPWPAPGSGETVFEAEDAAIITAACAATRQTLRSVRDGATAAGLIQALRNYTAKKADNPQTSFRQFWSQQPFRPTSYFGRGISFAGLERIEFPSAFAKAYYDLYNEDIQHTFAMFRGDLVSQTNIVVGLTNVAGVTAGSVLAKDEPSSLPRGTHIYGISAVLSSGETPPTYISTLAESSSPDYFLNELAWNSAPSALFYHVYRRSNIAGELTEYRLTDANEITGIPKFTNTPVTVAQHDTISTAYYAIKVVPQSGSFLGGISLLLSATAAITNTTQGLTLTLHADSGGSPGTLLATASNISFGSLITSPQEFTARFNVAVTPSATYWLKIGRTAAPTGGSVKIAVATSGTNQVATSTNNTSWSPVANRTAYFKLRGWLDNGLSAQFPLQRGIKLTGRIARTPRRLSVLVPEIDGLSDVIGPRYGLQGDPLLSEVESAETKNEMLVTVTARNGANGTPVQFSVTIPKGTQRGRRFLLGTASQLFDRIDDVSVHPGARLTLSPNGQIDWSAYDFITVETAP